MIPTNASMLRLPSKYFVTMIFTNYSQQPIFLIFFPAVILINSKLLQTFYILHGNDASMALELIKLTEIASILLEHQVYFLIVKYNKSDKLNFMLTTLGAPNSFIF